MVIQVGYDSEIALQDSLFFPANLAMHITKVKHCTINLSPTYLINILKVHGIIIVN